MVVTLLYEMQSLCNSFTLSLSGSDSRRSIRLERRQRCYDGDQGVDVGVKTGGSRVGGPDLCVLG